jgi:ribonuclease R
MTGDKVVIVIDNSRRSEKGPAGKVLKILERGMQQAVGVYCPSDFLGPSVLIANKDNELRVFVEYEPAFKNLKDGAAVLVEITHHPKERTAARGRITSVLADSLDSTTDDMHIIVKHKLRTFFPEDVINESAAVPQQINDKDLADRKDLREIPFVTIDGADARDFDDAVCAKFLDNGHIRLWVAIADVAHYVKPGTGLDKEAYERGTSVYFPHRVLPMLPERLSNGICSLNPNEDRLALVCEMDFEADGSKIRHKVYEAVFHSKKRCVYEELQNYIDKPKEYGEAYPEDVKQSIKALYSLYKAVQAQRTARGSVDLELPESKVVIGKKGEVLEIKRLERKDTHRLIEEFMIAANEAVAEIMEEHKLAFIFRVHEPPAEDAFQRFLDVANSFGIVIPITKSKNLEQMITPHFYQEIASNIKDSASARVLHFQLLRSMKQAFYSAENLKHFGLASTAYSHFTSPIRRYPDLIVHRLLKSFIRKDKRIAQTAQGSIAEDLATAAQHCSQRERFAADAEREMIRMKQVRYAEAHIGKEFMGNICGINQRGIFVELQEVSLEGFVSADKLGAGCEFIERAMTMKIGRTGRNLRLGDAIKVQIVKTNPHLLQIDLEPCDEFFKAKPEKKRKSFA